MKKIFLLFSFLCFANASDNFYYQNNNKVFLTPITINQKVQKRDLNQTDIIHFYKTDRGQTVGISKAFILKLKEEKILDKLVEKYQLTVKKRLTQKLYLMEAKSIEETLDICNRLYEENNVSYAHPDFIKKIKSR